MATILTNTSSMSLCRQGNAVQYKGIVESLEVVSQELNEKIEKEEKEIIEELPKTEKKEENEEKEKVETTKEKRK